VEDARLVMVDPYDRVEVRRHWNLARANHIPSFPDGRPTPGCRRG
jgi:hypothetical protein